MSIFCDLAQSVCVCGIRVSSKRRTLVLAPIIVLFLYRVWIWWADKKNISPIKSSPSFVNSSASHSPCPMDGPAHHSVRCNTHNLRPFIYCYLNPINFQIDVRHHFPLYWCSLHSFGSSHNHKAPRTHCKYLAIDVREFACRKPTQKATNLISKCRRIKEAMKLVTKQYACWSIRAL